MKNWKKLLTVALLLLLALALVACEAAVSVTSVKVDENGDLIVTMSDGSTHNAGKVTGEQGEKGEQGTPGQNGANGKDGYTPYIGENGNWWINGVDTGFLAVVKDENPQGLAFYLQPDGTYAVAVGEALYLDVITIPATYKGKAVTTIVREGFESCPNLTSVTIPDSVTSIGEGAFNGCTSLSSITLPFIGAGLNGTNNTHFGYIFGASSYSYNNDYVPSSLKTVIITGGTTISPYAFAYCNKLTSVEIPDSVTTIGEEAFYDCSSLTKVVISDIAAWCNIRFSDYFANPLYYAEHLYLGENEITELVIPDGVTSIGDYAFSSCTSLTSVVIPDSVTSIDDYAFSSCTSLTSMVIGDSVTSIDYAAFYDCTSLTSVVIPDSVTSIGYSAFYNCTSLTSVTFAEGCKATLGEHVFSGCPKLRTQYGNCTYIAANGNPYYILYSCNNKNLSTYQIHPDTKMIGGNVFYSCSHLSSITIPDSVTSIGDDAFAYCRSLTSVVFPDSVTTIGDYAFRDCASLTSVVIPDSVSSIGDYAFDWCTSLTSVVIPDSVTTIGDYAFDWCTSLTSVVIGDSVTSIGDNAFRYCTSLASIQYRGTQAQWEAISKGSDWNYNTGNYTVTYNYTGD